MHGVGGTHSTTSLRPCISIGYTGSSSSGGGSTPTPAKPGRTIADGTYFIRNMNSGKYLDVIGSGTVNKSGVGQYDFTGYKNQQWRITYQSDGYYRISPVHASSKALDMLSESSSRQNGTTAWIYDYKPTVQEQKWIIKTATGGGYEFITKPSSSTSSPKALEIANSSKANGAKAQIWTSSKSRTNDNWVLEPTSCELPTPQIGQQKANWCWVTVAYMAVRTHMVVNYSLADGVQSVKHTGDPCHVVEAAEFFQITNIAIRKQASIRQQSLNVFLILADRYWGQDIVIIFWVSKKWDTLLLSMVIHAIMVK